MEFKEHGEEEAWTRLREAKERIERLAQSEQPSDAESSPAIIIDKSTESTQVPYLTARLEDIPPEAEMDEGITIGCWDGKRFVSWEEWRIKTPFRQ